MFGTYASDYGFIQKHWRPGRCIGDGDKLTAVGAVDPPPPAPRGPRPAPAARATRARGRAIAPPPPGPSSGSPRSSETGHLITGFRRTLSSPKVEAFPSLHFDE